MKESGLMPALRQLLLHLRELRQYAVVPGLPANHEGLRRAPEWRTDLTSRFENLRKQGSRVGVDLRISAEAFACASPNYAFMALCETGISEPRGGAPRPILACFSPEEP